MYELSYKIIKYIKLLRKYGNIAVIAEESQEMLIGNFLKIVR